MRTLLVLLLLASSACAGAVGSECELDEECAEGLTCFAQTCQQLGEPGGTLTFEVVPQPGTGLHAATFAMGRQPLRFGFCAPEAIAGTVEAEATVLIHGTPAGLPGQVRHFQQQVDGDFTLGLPPGTWTLEFLLAPGEDGPPPPPERRAVQLARCETEPLGLVATAAAAGLARFAVLVDPVRDPRPRCGLLARIHDPLTGAALSQTLAIEHEEGAPCTTPAGGWALPFAAPSGGEIELRLVPAAGAYPTVAERAVLLPAPDDDVIHEVGVGEAAVLERITVEVAGPDGAPVAAATVRAIPLVEPGADRFEPPPAAEIATGRYELWLLPGSYRIEAEPPPFVAAATGRCLAPPEGGPCDEVAIVESGAPASYRIDLQQQLVLTGRVAAPDRTSLGGARIRALPVEGGRWAETVSAPSGRYELQLDPGRYELLVIPADPAAAWRRFEQESPLLQSGTLDLQLPEPARVVGTVVGTSDGAAVPLPRAVVRAWRVDGDEAKVVGESLTDAAGRFGLALPADD
ncbi:carboxypeptidase-like regulatory domain-containing protein [Vulgatibacter sp.]|uniref:carboxypeptidase-like regulatory domain-containing protein n=1 Tax=Vulgatibacter sp. TaxID=1971226 RepID=UPI003569A039